MVSRIRDGYIQHDAAINSVMAKASANENMCNGCSQCANVCAYGAITYIDKEFRLGGGRTEVRRVASVNPAVCQGCGACTVTCPSGAMDLSGFSSKQIMSEVEEICKK